MVKTFKTIDLFYLVTGIQLKKGMSVDEMISFISLEAPPATKESRRKAINIIMYQHPILRRMLPQCCTASFIGQFLSSREMRFRGIKNGTANCLHYIKPDDWASIIYEILKLVGDNHRILDMKTWQHNLIIGEPYFNDYKNGHFMVQDI